MKAKLEKAYKAYYTVLEKQNIAPEHLDYTVLEKKHIPFLEQLQTVNNSAITVFDIYQKKHVYMSSNFESTLGFDKKQAQEQGNAYFDYKVHPEDLYTIITNGTLLFEFCQDIAPEKVKQYKLINEYRILNAENKYLRVVEQMQLLEQDRQGNMWLALCIMDIAPNQNLEMPCKSTLLNFVDKQVRRVPELFEKNTNKTDLSKREKQVLTLLHQGKLSKEIADILYISIHTVNTHRQRILSKLKASNTPEALQYATNLGLLA